MKSFRLPAAAFLAVAFAYAAVSSPAMADELPASDPPAVVAELPAETEVPAEPAPVETEGPAPEETGWPAPDDSGGYPAPNDNPQPTATEPPGPPDRSTWVRGVNCVEPNADGSLPPWEPYESPGLAQVGAYCDPLPPEIPAPVVEVAPAAPVIPTLPETGANPAPLVAGALALLASGLGLAVLARRRTSTH